jgi:ubiquinone/menaquinone biosynthesis C-methylase UbiE
MGAFTYRQPGLFGTANQWKRYEDFSIDTLLPSKVVMEGSSILPEGMILDCGCGQGRNTLFFVREGREVVALDAKDEGWYRGLHDAIKQNISFHNMDILKFRFEDSAYAGVVMSRLIQYFKQADMEWLLQCAANALQPKGILMLSYTASGGIHDATSKVDMYPYPKEHVLEVIADAGMEILTCSPGTPSSTHVPHSGLPAETYDILARRNA